MFCKNCGKEIDDNAYVCPNCGVKVEREESQPAAPAVSANSNSKLKTKNTLNVCANVCAIVFMGIMLFGAIILLAGAGLVGDVAGSVAGDAGYDPDVAEAAFDIVKIITIILIIFCIVTIVMAGLAIAKGKGNKGMGFKIAVIVMIGIVAILEFVGGGIVYGILCLVPVGLEIASLCIKAEEPAA